MEIIIGIITFLFLFMWIRLWFSNRMEKRSLKKRIEELQTHISMYMDVSNKGIDSIKKENERLQKENENFRITINTLQQKPDQQQKRLLHIYDRAIRQMITQIPTFGTHWELALQQSEKEENEINVGTKAFVPKIISSIFQRVLPQKDQNLLASKDEI